MQFFSLSARHRVYHILDKDPVPRGRIVDQHVGDRTDELAVLNDWAAAQVCGQEGTTNFNILCFGLTMS